MQMLINNNRNIIFKFKIPELLGVLIKSMNHNNIINNHLNNNISNSHLSNHNNLTIRSQILVNRNKQISQLVQIRRLKKVFLIPRNFWKIKIHIITTMIKNNNNLISKLFRIHQR